MTSGQIELRRTDRIGDVAAEDDINFLKQCFVRNDDSIDILRDSQDSRAIVLGRTGAGKTAILIKLQEEEERVIKIDPELLAIEHISNSDILRFFIEVGVNLSLFFKLLWRHVFVVEIIRDKYQIISGAKNTEFFGRIKNLFKKEEDVRAINYLRQYGDSFWKETHYRVREIISKLENDLTAGVKSSVAPGIEIDASTADRISEEERLEVVKKAQNVISTVQAKELSGILDLLDNILTDRQKVYYISIDKLDENWVEDKLRYKLIRALVETVRDFRKVKNAKIIVAIRQDLIERVFQETMNMGFQAEKYRSFYVPIVWSRTKLIEVLDQRIDYLFKDRYTTQRVTHKDVLPLKIKGQNTLDYLLDRTLMRPRDVILFFNYCIGHINDGTAITKDVIKRAEPAYSQSRLDSLQDEWRADYPHLAEFARILRLRESEVMIGEFTEDDCLDLAMKLTSRVDFYDQMPDRSIASNAKKMFEDEISPKDFRRKIFLVFQKVGLVGLMAETYDGYRWRTNYHSNVDEFDIDEMTLAKVHPAFWSVLGINP